MNKKIISLVVMGIAVSFSVGILVGFTNSDTLILDQVEGDSVLIEQLENELQEKTIENQELSRALTVVLKEYTELSEYRNSSSDFLEN